MKKIILFALVGLFVNSDCAISKKVLSDKIQTGLFKIYIPPAGYRLAASFIYSLQD